MTKGIPTDTFLNLQWHLGTGPWSINVQDIWSDYTGEGVIVGVLDDGFDYNHPDLNPNYRFDLDYDSRDNDFDAKDKYYYDEHGTAVMGLIGGDDNGTGIVGVAFDSDLVGYQMNFGFGLTIQGIADDLARGIGTIDIFNNSWGFTSNFVDNFSNPAFDPMKDSIENLAKDGRNNLGIITVFSAGNAGHVGGSANYTNMKNSPYTIAVGALDEDGTTGTGFSNGQLVDFSSPGSNVLISAPGMNVYTSDLSGGNGYSSTDYAYFGGTSAAAPIISGVVALMLEANPDLGYRDVQEILAYTAQKNDPNNAGWQTNGAGLEFNHLFGFGLVDATAAVRLAETWTLQQTYSNVATVSAFQPSSSVIPIFGSVTASLNITQNIDIEHVLIDVFLTHANIGELTITLISPDGTESVLMDNPNSSLSTLDFQFSSVAHWGEGSAGIWSLRVDNLSGPNSGFLFNWNLTFLGDEQSQDDLYIYTDSLLPTIFEDLDGGTDTVNLAAISQNVTIDLRRETGNSISGQNFMIMQDTQIENIIGSVFDDSLTANDLNNEISGNAGNDLIRGLGGNDSINGDDGNDTLRGDAGMDTINGGAGEDNIRGGSGNDNIVGGEDDDIINGDDGDDTISGNQGNDILRGAEGNDILNGNTGNDDARGGDGDDEIFGGEDDDRLEGDAGNDRLFGEDGIDALRGELGDDLVDGGAGNDDVRGGEGNDILNGGDDDDLLIGGNSTPNIYSDNDILNGNNGNDDVRGYLGDDLYLLSDGEDRFFDTGGFDQIFAGYDLKLEDLKFYTNPDDKGDLMITSSKFVDQSGLNNSQVGFTTELENQFASGKFRFEELIFYDGSRVDLYNYKIWRWGTDSDETVSGFDHRDDTMIGLDGNDILDGKAGNDYIFGNQGNDELFGHIGNDVLSGGDGNDILRGGEGNDELFAGAGNDILFGDDGADMFVFYGFSYSNPSNLSEIELFDGLNIIEDFSETDGDILKFMLFTEYQPGSEPQWALDDNPMDFISSQTVGNDTHISIDKYAGRALSPQHVVTLKNTTDIDLQQLYDNGQLIIS